ncbi:alpha/beta fold hydrolase [Planktothricoides raciborskii]|uniref:Alpha/beta fold hydrolase n=1 Tax=Planktothricoides raciborskii FACHB-1370 TaxID=2949576 RepID=A0ABR8EBR7_9CYAN|nr:alpha/beta fold hydrolase [Planktothricoides raciborskii]MBD2543613.1 alpha/beta fold hydrolase [Planktothricoides raciborskii FACHB-1370]MBD2581302.1 alpha/beta fold hydrolase [Planktothricoides raciborskii FACHB-1261]
MQAKIRDTEIYFDIEGAGLVIEGDRMKERPTAFLVHGGPGGDHTSYKAGLSDLSQKMQLVYFDHRGQGRSARGPKETYTLENNVEDMEALRQYLGLDKIIVIGGSYGGMVALSYAIKYPQNLSHLIVIATVSDYRFLEKAKQFIAEKGTDEQKKYAELLWAGNFKDEAELKAYFQVMAPLYSVTYNPEAKNQSDNRTIYSVDAINQAFGGFLRTYNILDRLHKITAPTLVIGGRHDWICPPEFSEEIAAAIPNSDLRIFENSGHLIRVDEPQALKDAIAGFIVYKK